MIRTLKAGRSEAAKVGASAEVRETVERILADVAERGDEAVRRYSSTFDDWSPESFAQAELRVRRYGGLS